MEDLIKAVRALSGDDEEPYVLKDEQIEGILLATDSSPTLAAAVLLERIATEEALLYRYLRTDGLTVSGHYGAQVILERAKALRAQAGEEAKGLADESFEIVYAAEPKHYPDEYVSTRYVQWL